METDWERLEEREAEERRQAREWEASRPMVSEDPLDRILQLSADLQRVQDALTSLANEYRVLAGKHEVAQRTHDWAYSKWWLRPFLPYEPKDGRELMRCRTCGGLFWSDQCHRHIGHFFSAATEGSWWEFLRVKLGWV